MRPRPAAAVLALLGLAAILTGCDAVADAVATPPIVQCGQLLAAECDAVAGAAVARLNLAATGAIDGIVVTRLECAAVANTAKREAWGRRQTCWVVDAAGDRTHGFVAITRGEDGAFETVLLNR